MSQTFGANGGPADKQQRVLIAIIGVLVVAIVAMVLFLVLGLGRSGDDQPDPDNGTPTATSEQAGESTEAEQPAAPAEPQVLDASQIGAGQYASAEGSWTSPQGGQLEISGGDIVWTNSGRSFATVAGLNLTDAASGQTATASAVAGDAGATILQWSYDVGGYNHGTVLAFYPAGVASTELLGLPLVTDASVDRIVALPGNGVGRLMPSDLGPYVSTRQAAAPANETASGCTAPVEGAYPCAGGPVPAEAIELTSIIETPYGSRYGVLKSADGDIGCDIITSDGKTSMYCLVYSWSTSAPVEPVNRAPVGLPIVVFGDGSEQPYYGGGKSDVPCFEPGGCTQGSATVQPHALQAGQVVHHAGFVCAGQQDGMTCWNAATGHGAYFGAQVFRPF